MSRWLLLIAVGCSSSPKPPAGGWAPLPPETSQAPTDAAVLAPEVEAVATNALGTFEETPVFPPSGPPCMPAGDYAVTFDLTAAKFDARGMDHQLCLESAVTMPRDTLGTLKLSFEGGALAIDWPDRKKTAAIRQCSFTVQGPPIAAQVTFTDGAGTGTATYAFSSTTNPADRCTVRDAKLTIAKQ